MAVSKELLQKLSKIRTSNTFQELTIMYDIFRECGCEVRGGPTCPQGSVVDMEKCQDIYQEIQFLRHKRRLEAEVEKEFLIKSKHLIQSEIKEDRK